MVRVGSLTDKIKENKKKKDRTGLTPSQQLDAVFTAVRRLQPIAEDAYRKNMDELKKYGFEHVNFETATPEEFSFLELYFKRELKPFISGLVINDALPFPFLKNKELYVAVNICTKKGISVGIIPVGHEHSERLISLGNNGKRFILEEEVVLHFAHLMFKGCKIQDRAIIRVTRNADIQVSSKNTDFRERMEEIKNVRVFNSHIPLDLSYFYQLQELDTSPELHFPVHTPRKSAMITDSRSVFSQVKSKDILLSYPFESMTSSFIRLLEESAVDSKVTSIKITLYRLARNSKVISALCTAAENGKDVLVMIELRARFDEENNIEWSKILQKAGVTVIYGPKEYKAHSKLLLITRKSTGGHVDYVTQIGTGNYNEKTSAIYTDMMLLTADRDIAQDAEAVFTALRNGTFVEKTNKLLVSPLALRPQVLDMMDEQISIAKNGGKGYIGAKVNSLNDKAIIDKLVEASQAGVKIELIVRGVCCIIAGVPEYTENISVRSIVGRFLEHSRIFIFGVEGKEQKIYIGSADYMSRNTIRRVEVAAPIEDERLKKRIREMFNILMKDNVKARIMLSDGTYIHAECNEGDEKINSQEYFYDEAYRRLDEKIKKQERMSVLREKKAEKSGRKSEKTLKAKKK